MSYFDCMSRLRILGRPGQTRVLAPCREAPHPAYVDAQSTQKKRRMQALGAQLARVRVQAGMRAQADLAAASGVSVRTISLIETGEKIPRVTTMRKIESALHLPPGSTDEYLEGARTELAPGTAARTVHPQGLDDLSPIERELVLASHAEIARRATNMVEDLGVSRAETWLESVLNLRERHRQQDAPGLDEDTGRSA
jgi:transcriptional regulator with XRE-family HTH domain